MSNLPIVIGLGLAGIDPVGMLVLMGSLSTGLSKQKALLFGLLVLFGTSLTGTIFSELLGSTLRQLGNVLSKSVTILNNVPDIGWVIFNLVVIIALIYWGLQRDNKKHILEEKGQKSSKGLWFGAVFMIFTAVTDPSFLAVLALSGHKGNIILSFLYSFIWTILSQAPLFLLMVAILFNQHVRFVTKFNQMREKYQHLIHNFLTGLIYLIALVFVADLLSFLSTGQWLL